MGIKQIDILRNTRKKIRKKWKRQEILQKENFVHVDSVLPYLSLYFMLFKLFYVPYKDTNFLIQTSNICSNMAFSHFLNSFLINNTFIPFLVNPFTKRPLACLKLDVGCYGLERQHLGSKELMLRVQAPTEAVIKL